MVQKAFMGFWDKLFGKSAPRSFEESPAWTQFEQKNLAQAARNAQLFVGGNAPRRGDRDLIRAYRQSPMFHSAVSKVAGNAAQVPFRLYAPTEKNTSGRRIHMKRVQALSRRYRQKELHLRLDKDQIEEITDHPFLDLMDRPNPQMTGRMFLYLLYGWLDVLGEGFVIIESKLRGRKAVPKAMWPIPPHWIVQFPQGERNYYEVMMGGKTIRVNENDMVWLRHPDLEFPYSRGTAGGRAVADDLDIDERAAIHINGFFYNRALPDMIVSVPEADDDQLAAAREKWEHENQGFNRSYRTAWVSGEVTVERLDTSFNDMEIIELRRYSRDLVYQTFGISPEMLGILEDSNRATISEARYLFSENVLTPRIDLVCTELQRTVVPMYDKRLILSYDDPVPDDNEFRFKVLRDFPHIASINEARALASLPERDDGDRFLVEDGNQMVESFVDYEAPERGNGNELDDNGRVPEEPELGGDPAQEREAGTVH